MADFDAMARHLILGQRDEVRQAVEVALTEGWSATAILERGLIPAMSVVGEKMTAGEYYLPQVLVAARAMYAGLDLLRPHLTQAAVPTRGTAVLGTVKGDVHDIGKNLVAMMLEGAGFRVINLGADVSPERFAEAVRTSRPEILGMSAMLSTTMLQMGATVKLLTELGLRDSVRIMIGGAPVNQAWAEEIGADAYCPNSAVAVQRARELVSQNRRDRE